MTEKDTTEGRPRWIKEAQEALDRTGDALRSAWEATRESRMSALEAAKVATRELGEALERGVEAAKERWESEDEEKSSESTSAEGASEGSSESEAEGGTIVAGPDGGMPEDHNPNRPPAG